MSFSSYLKVLGGEKLAVDVMFKTMYSTHSARVKQSAKAPINRTEDKRYLRGFQFQEMLKSTLGTVNGFEKRNLRSYEKLPLVTSQSLVIFYPAG